MKRLMLPAILALAAISLLAATGVAEKDNSKRGWLGVYTQSVDYDIAEAFDLDVPYGAVINEVIDDSPADEAGLRDGDVVISMNGEKITDSDDLIDMMYETAPGDRVELVIVRDGKEQTVSLEAGTAPEKVRERYQNLHWYSGDPPHPNIVIPNFEHTYLGVSLNDLSDQLGAFFGVENGDGALITEVIEDSPAEKAGLKAGDVIVAVNGEPVEDASDASDLINEYDEGDDVEVSVIRDRKPERFTATLETTEDMFFGNRTIITPDIAALKAPKLRGLFKGNWRQDFDADFDSEEFEREMEKLAEELSKMKFEFQGLEELDFDREEFRREMEELRRELKEMKLELQRELQDLRDER